MLGVFHSQWFFFFLLVGSKEGEGKIRIRQIREPNFSNNTYEGEWLRTDTDTSNKPAILLEKDEINFSLNSESAARKA